MVAVPVSQRHVPVWDLPTRLCHWLLVILVVDAWISQKFGDARLSWHLWNGYAILTLLVFRLIWGFVGSQTARFATFITRWSTVHSYVKALLEGRAPSFLGHNPAGGWSVVVMLILLTLHVGCGLFASDELMATGPLNFLVSSTTAGKLTTWHSLGFWLLLAVISVHVCGVFFHWFSEKDNLILPMITGTKTIEKVPPDAAVAMRSPWLALVVLTGSVLLVWFGIQVWKW